MTTAEQLSLVIMIMGYFFVFFLIVSFAFAMFLSCLKSYKEVQYIKKISKLVMTSEEAFKTYVEHNFPNKRSKQENEV